MNLQVRIEETRVSIWHLGAEIAQTEGIRPLHCHNNRDFWVSWENGFVRLGEGYILGGNVLVEGTVEQGTTYDISAIGYGSPVDPYGSRWMVHERAGKTKHILRI